MMPIPSDPYQGWKEVMVIIPRGILYGALVAWRRNLRASMLARAWSDIFEGWFEVRVSRPRAVPPNSRQTQADRLATISVMSSCCSSGEKARTSATTEVSSDCGAWWR